MRRTTAMRIRAGRRLGTWAALALWTTGAVALAQAPPTTTGERPVRLVLASGETIEGVLLEVGSRVYRVRIDGKVREVPEGDVREVEMLPAAWPLLNLAGVPEGENAALIYQLAIGESTEEPEALVQIEDDVVALRTPAGKVIRDWLDRNETTIEYLLRGAKLTRCTFGSPVREGEALPRKLQRCTSLLRLHALRLEADGHPKQGLEVSFAMVRFGGHVAQDPPLVPALVGMAIARSGLQTAGEIFGRHPALGADPTMLGATMAIPEAPGCGERTLRGELAYFRRGIETWRARAVEEQGALSWREFMERSGIVPVGSSPTSTPSSGGAAGPRSREPIRGAAFDAVTSDAVAKYEAYVQGIGPLFEMSWPQAHAALARRSLTWRHNVLLRFLGQTLEGFLKKTIQHRARVRALKVWAEIQAFRAGEKRAPTSLDEVAKRLGDPLPLDPLTGKAFRLVREPKRVVLESAARADDGTRPLVSFEVALP